MAHAENDPAFSLRKVAGHVGIGPSCLSKIERGRLCLAEEQLGPDGDRHRLALRIGPATFRLGEMESVLRLDDDTGAADEPGETPAPLEPEA